MSAPSEVRERAQQPTMSRADEQVGIARANAFQAAIESRAREEWASLAPIALDWLIDTNDPADAWQIVWLCPIDRRARLWRLEQDYVQYRAAHVSIGEEIEIEREIEEEE